METQVAQERKQKTRFEVGDRVVIAIPCEVVEVETETKPYFSDNPVDTIRVSTAGDELFEIQDDPGGSDPAGDLAVALRGREMRIVTLRNAEDEILTGLFAVAVAVAKR